MGSIASSENEGPPSLGTECATCGHSLNWHMGQGDRTKVLKCDAASGECGCAGFTREPPDSASSSPNDVCRCGHTRLDHQESTGMLGGQCDACYITLPKRRTMDWRHDFAPAKPETTECGARWIKTGEQDARCSLGKGHDGTHQGGGLQWPERVAVYPLSPGPAPKAECVHLGEGGCCYGPGYCAHGCREAADELSRQTQDMEPECDGCGHAPHAADQCPGRTFGERCECDEPLDSEPETPVLVREDCGVCGEPHDSVACPEPEAPECGALDNEHCCPMGCQLKASPPRRPPYAVAYATEGGAQYEIALPGDASVRAVDGALIITHDSAVLALSHVRPMDPS